MLQSDFPTLQLKHKAEFPAGLYGDSVPRIPKRGTTMVTAHYFLKLVFSFQSHYCVIYLQIHTCINISHVRILFCEVLYHILSISSS